MRRGVSSVLVLLTVLLVAGCSLLGSADPTPVPHATAVPYTTAVPHATPVPNPTAIVRAPAGWSGGTIGVEALPPEALDTLLLIEEGGPFPYDQDGSTFQNREGILPDQPRGYYREYTVETPGSPDRGARRVVTGRDGERYYTDDHYESFRFIVGDPGS
jgi:ribonuclease T1